MKKLLILTLFLTGCQTALLKDTRAAYQYQKEMYQSKCPQPPIDFHQQTACGVRDAELMMDYIIVKAAEDAYIQSQGGKLPTAAIDQLKRIKKQLDAEKQLP